MRDDVKKNYVFNLIYQLVTLIVPIITIPYLSRVLLETGVGKVSFADSIAAYFVLFAGLGSLTYAQKEIGAKNGNKIEESRVFWEILIIRLVTSMVAIFAYLPIIFLGTSNRILTAVYGLHIVSNMVDISWFYHGKVEFSKTATVNVAGKLVATVLIFLLVRTPSDLNIYALISCLTIVCSNLAMWLLLPSRIIRVKGLSPKRHIKPILALFIPTIAIQVYTVLDKSMIGWFSSTSAENGYYEYSEKIVRMCVTLVSALSTVILSKVSKKFAERDEQAIKNYIYKAVSYTWLVAIALSVGIFAVADVFVPVYFGERFMKAIVLLKTFAPLIIFVGFANVIGVAYLIAIGKHKIYVISVIIAAVANFIINLILIPRYFSVGAAIASVVAEGIGISIQVAYVFRNKMLSAKKFFALSYKNLIAGAIMFAVVKALSTFVLTAVTALNLAGLVVAGALSYLLALIILKDKFLFETVINKIIHKLKKN